MNDFVVNDMLHFVGNPKSVSPKFEHVCPYCNI
ncbi:MAG: hypothetical protein HeimC3_45610 [Candidatus Heimdallarchaeota archaeon LC_3]|nr:MAG: hypothetical protein HeimC3_45610 [Candidatus Heimdallarchaeota archaeon LC_3]